MGVADPGSSGPWEWRNLEVADPNPIFVYGTSSICLRAPNRRRSYVCALMSALLCWRSYVCALLSGLFYRALLCRVTHTVMSTLQVPLFPQIRLIPRAPLH